MTEKKKPLPLEIMKALEGDPNVKPKAGPPKMDPTKPNMAEELPNDAVALVVWRECTGPQPMTVVVTRDSWERNRKFAVREGKIDPERAYVFESPINHLNRQSTFFLQGVTSWVGNVYYTEEANAD